MRIHLVLKKEELQPELLPGKEAVVFDVLLATTVITAVLAAGAKRVCPVLDEEEAKLKHADPDAKDAMLVGEKNGLLIDGFHMPSPTQLSETVKGKDIILSTTNGTVALRKSEEAERVYASSLLNNETIARELLRQGNDDIVMVCAGSTGQFCLEDFYGAGHLVAHLASHTEITCNDAALTAWKFYQSCPEKPVDLLKQARVGHMLSAHGFAQDLSFAAEAGNLDVVPVVASDGWITDEGGKTNG
ncbi:2-phosphosulfolactate phosphatase [Thalassobacillus sp. CUG 92003]|uniref:2-phosphosulfolactate phosphatase n=1 Tax=Thalassobacillus sp. CUG 92003 TaxID=2736641 RepID=UPI0015E71EE6|nr:2-phosphosulfolactate phosphatase [Thalassobacillus sp. CUG 92003]